MPHIKTAPHTENACLTAHTPTHADALALTIQSPCKSSYLRNNAILLLLHNEVACVLSFHHFLLRCGL